MAPVLATPDTETEKSKSKGAGLLPMASAGPPMVTQPLLMVWVSPVT